MGLNRSMGDVGAMVAPILAGVLIDHFSFRVAFVVMAVLIMVGSGVAFLLTATRPQHSAAAA